MFQAGKDIVVFENPGVMVVRIKESIIPGAFYRSNEIKIIANDATHAYLHMPWSDYHCGLLHGVGIDCTLAAPIWDKGKLKIDGVWNPMNHQLFTAAFMTLNKRGYILSDPRTGKTGSAILGIDYMQKHGILRGGVLVITTATTLNTPWESSVELTIPGKVVSIVHGKDKFKKLNTYADVYITNYDTCRLHADKIMDAIKVGRIVAVCIDELTHVGSSPGTNKVSKRHKAIYNICNKSGVEYVWGMTGSAWANPVAVFGMAKVVNEGKLPCALPTTWEDIVTYQYGQQKWMRKVRPSASDTIFKTLQPSVRFRKDAIMDLPPVILQHKLCSMSKEQQRVCDELKEEACALLASGEVVTVQNKRAMYGKFLQIAQGFVLNRGIGSHIPHDSRISIIAEIVGSTPYKTVIFSQFKYTIKKRVDQLRALGYSADYVDGSVTGEARNRVIVNFDTSKDPHVLVCHPITVGYGVELSAADKIIFDGPPMLGVDRFIQSMERISSLKQRASSVSIVFLSASPLEQSGFKSLTAGKSLYEETAAMFETLTRGELYHE